MRKLFLTASAMLLMISSQSFASLVTTIGSATVVRGSSGGFFNLPISVRSNLATNERFGGYLGSFNIVGTPANSFRVFVDPQIGPDDPISGEPTFIYSLFNQPGMVGFNGFANAVTVGGTPSTFLSSANGTTVNIGLEATSSVLVTPTGGTLAFLPVSTNLPVGVYQLVGAIESVTNTGIENDDIVVAGTFTVTAVPEPSALALFAVVGISGLAIRRFRTANKKTAV